MWDFSNASLLLAFVILFFLTQYNNPLQITQIFDAVAIYSRVFSLTDSSRLHVLID